MYKDVNENFIQHNETGEFIPKDARHRIYRKFQEWESRGNTLEAADAIPEPVKSIQDRVDSLLLKLANPSDPADIDEKNSLLRELGGS